MKKIKTFILASIITTSLIGAAPAVFAASKTVYYGDYALHWDYGRSWGVNSYSKVQSSSLDHLATANTTSSGWKAPEVLASASQFVGTGSAYAYWDARY